MPERNQLMVASVTAKVDATTYKGSAQSALGYRSSILQLNNAGKFLPGVYRCNANTLFRLTGRCKPTEVPTQTISGMKMSVSGDVAAWLFIMQTAWFQAYQRSAWNTSLENEAIVKAYAKVMNSDLEVGVMLGELRETIEGLRHPLQSLRKEFDWLRNNWSKLKSLEDTLRTAGYYKNLKITDSIKRIQERLAHGGVPRTANALAGTWLEWRYGIRPLISTIQDILKHVEEQNRSFTEKLQRRQGKTSIKTTRLKSVVGRSLGPIYIAADVTTTSSVRTFASTAFKFDSPLTWQQRYGLDITSIPEIAWELLPLSFVADWFLSVGTWLGALRTLASPVTVLGTSVSQKIYATVEIVPNRFEAYTSKLKANDAGSATYTIEELQRVCRPPGLGSFVPALNSKALDLSKSIDMVSLLWQRIPNIKGL